MGASRAINGTALQKLEFAPQMMRYLSWVKSYYSDGGMMQFRNVILNDGTPMPYTDIGTQLRASAATWDHLPWVREIWGDRPVIIKGVQCVEDARLAVEHGADAIVVSNHGGRQMDRVYPTLYMLKEIAPAPRGLPGSVSCLTGGVRSGADVVIALAHGADAVLAGRAYLYGLGAGGEAGVRKAFAILKKEIEDTMRLLGCGSIHELDAGTHLLPHPFAERS